MDGTMLDLAEYITLDVLQDSVKEICQVYRSGATVWIISDGHALSDCSMCLMIDTRVEN